MNKGMKTIKAGIDTGGTFTDFAVLDQHGRWRKQKILSTPDNPARAIMEGLESLGLLDDDSRLEIVHGTTVGTNAFLERKGARTVLVTTSGFEDVIFIGRQARPELYNFMVEKPRPIIPRENVVGIRERMGPDGRPVIPLEQQAIDSAVEFCRQARPRSVAVCFLHAYACPDHELAVARRLRQELGVPVSCSCEVMPEFREYERFSTTLVNAYLNPVVGNYLRRLCASMEKATIFIQQSNGGCAPAESVRERAVTTLLSGPAGGVQAAFSLARSMGIDDIITFDMGGTSTDVSLCSGGLTYTRDYMVDGYPVGLPIIDINTVGAGGGSVAWIDRGGLMRVGPQSAGADPGPACYGKGNEITVTDANLFLGRLLEDRFLGGGMRLHRERVLPGLERLSTSLGIGLEDTALGIVRLVNSSMVQAIRAVSVERGFEPGRAVLVCYGGAAGLHAAEVADALKIGKIIVPDRAGVFSARGMADADLMFEKSRAFLARDALQMEKEIEAAARELLQELFSDMKHAVDMRGMEACTQEIMVDCRFRGQSYELTVPWGPDWHERFLGLHRRLYGYVLEARPVEVTAIRVRASVLRNSGADASPELQHAFPGSCTMISGESFEKRPVVYASGTVRTSIVMRSELREGTSVAGPAIVADDFTTILVPGGWCATCHLGNLVLQRQD